jgi:hypothetical protein
VDRQKLAAEYLAPLADMTEGQAAYVFRQQTSIEFRGGDDLRRQWDAALSAQETEIRNFVRTAKEHGLGSVAGMMLRIEKSPLDPRPRSRPASSCWSSYRSASLPSRTAFSINFSPCPFSAVRIDSG